MFAFLKTESIQKDRAVAEAKNTLHVAREQIENVALYFVNRGITVSDELEKAAEAFHAALVAEEGRLEEAIGNIQLPESKQIDTPQEEP